MSQYKIIIDFDPDGDFMWEDLYVQIVPDLSNDQIRQIVAIVNAPISPTHLKTRMDIEEIQKRHHVAFDPEDEEFKRMEKMQSTIGQGTCPDIPFIPKPKFPF